MNQKPTLDWNEYLAKAAEAVSEGIVMVRNENAALPLRKDVEVAVFGRIQLHYYKSGTGSGGMVNVAKVTGILDGLLEAGVRVNEKLLAVYKAWDEAHPFNLGHGWGAEPWAQEEMPLDEALVQETASACKTAIVIIGRTAGEEQDNHANDGSYLLTAGEREMLRLTRAHFERVIVLLNVGNIMDMGFVDDYSPDAVLYVWQGGMTGGTGTAWVLTGKVPLFFVLFSGFLPRFTDQLLQHGLLLFVQAGILFPDLRFQFLRGMGDGVCPVRPAPGQIIPLEMPA